MALVTICEEESKGRSRGKRGKGYSMYLFEDLDKKGKKGSFEKLPLNLGMEDPSYSAMVFHSGFLYVIGGRDSKSKPKADVLIYPIHPSSVSQSHPIKGPSLNSAKCHPIAVSAQNQLYVFSRILLERLHDPDSFRYLEELPRCEVLDLENSIWSSFDLPSLPPPPITKADVVYQIDAYASFSGGVYISIEDVCSYFVFVENTTPHWSFSPNELPFTGEAKCVEHHEYVYAGISRNSRQVCCFWLYKLVKDTRDVDNFYFDQLMVVSIPSVGDDNLIYDDWRFESFVDNKIGIIYSCTSSESLDSYAQTINLPHFMAVHTFELNWDAMGNEASSSSTHQTRGKRKKHSNIKLLGSKTYPCQPFHVNWCFMPSFH